MMTRKWKGSTGAKREHRAALQRGIPVTYERSLSENVHALSVSIRRKLRSLV
jgi:hypothetical protein